MLQKIKIHKDIYDYVVVNIFNAVQHDPLVLYEIMYLVPMIKYTFNMYLLMYLFMYLQFMYLLLNIDTLALTARESTLESDVCKRQILKSISALWE